MKTLFFKTGSGVGCLIFYVFASLICSIPFLLFNHSLIRIVSFSTLAIFCASLVSLHGSEISEDIFGYEKDYRINKINRFKLFFIPYINILTFAVFIVDLIVRSFMLLFSSSIDKFKEISDEETEESIKNIVKNNEKIISTIEKHTQDLKGTGSVDKRVIESYKKTLVFLESV